MGSPLPPVPADWVVAPTVDPASGLFDKGEQKEEQMKEEGHMC